MGKIFGARVETMRLLFADSLSLSYLVPVLYGVWTCDRLLLSSVILAALATHVLKQATATWAIGPRPAGAYGCGALCGGGASGGQPGFPSGHTAIAAAIVASFWLQGWNGAVWIGVPWVLLVAWARTAKECHTNLQVLAGAGIGSGIVYAVHWISD